MTVSFATVVRPQMGACDNCHTGNYAGNPFAWASARAVSMNPGGSLFLQKPSGAVSHTGGTVWPSGSAGYNAAVSWINGGLRP